MALTIVFDHETKEKVLELMIQTPNSLSLSQEKLTRRSK